MHRHLHTGRRPSPGVVVAAAASLLSLAALAACGGDDARPTGIAAPRAGAASSGGSALVVNVTNQIEDTWFDRAGNFHSEQLNVVERYTPAGDNIIQYEATMTDPKVFTRPWKISLPLYRRLDKNAQFLEFKCVPFSEELIYGNLRKK